MGRPIVCRSMIQTGGGPPSCYRFGMSNIGGLADVVRGEVIAPAVEPNADRAAHCDDHQNAACLNCDTALKGEHCHSCGQRGHVHRTLGAFAHDLLHGVLHFEGKTWRTLPMLAWKPGELTRRYVGGQRACFVSPIALFLFSVFLMFAVVSSLGAPTNVGSGELKSEITKDAREAEIEIKALETKREEALAAAQPTDKIDQAIVDSRRDARLVREMADRGIVRGSAAQISDDVPSWLAGPLRRAAANPELLLYKVQNNAYKYSWALIPLSLPFMLLLFPFSKRFLPYDHIVFVTYSLAFMTMLVVVASLLHAVGLGVVAGFVLLLPPLHMYRQLKGAYQLGRGSALWRTILLISFSITVAVLFVALLFAAGIS